MSEKRFVVKELNFEDTVIEDTVTKEQYNEYGVVDLLNEQQATIERLQKKIDNISNSYEKFYGVKLKYAHWLQGDD